MSRTEEVRFEAKHLQPQIFGEDKREKGEYWRESFKINALNWYGTQEKTQKQKVSE